MQAAVPARLWSREYLAFEAAELLADPDGVAMVRAELDTGRCGLRARIRRRRQPRNGGPPRPVGILGAGDKRSPEEQFGLRKAPDDAGGNRFHLAGILHPRVLDEQKVLAFVGPFTVRLVDIARRLLVEWIARGAQGDNPEEVHPGLEDRQVLDRATAASGPALAGLDQRRLPDDHAIGVDDLDTEVGQAGHVDRRRRGLPG